MNSGPTEYVVALCHMRNGELVPFAYERFSAANKAEAAARARDWANSTASVSAGRAWLQVKLAEAVIYTEELGAP